LQVHASLEAAVVEALHLLAGGEAASAGKLLPSWDVMVS
jgi:hypothetical protein